MTSISYVKKTILLLAGAFLVLIAAVITGYWAGDKIQYCDETVAEQYVPWVLAVSGILLGIMGAKVGFRTKRLLARIGLVLFVILFVLMAIFAWFVSVFCLQF